VIPESLMNVFHFGIERYIELDDIRVAFVLDDDGEVGGLEGFFH
jgi:hypothetical protein